MPTRTAEEKRQAVVFHALFEYQSQLFTVQADRGHVDSYDGDVMGKLPSTVDVALRNPRRRWEYWRDVMPPTWTDKQVDDYQFKHWCGAFTLFCLKLAGLAPDIFWADGLGYVEPHHFPRVSRPEPGDVAYFSKNSHYAIVEATRDTPSGVVVFDSIDGNQGRTLATPSIRRYSSRAVESVAAFYSISQLLEQAE